MRWLLAGVLAVTLGLAGCSGDDSCQGQTYDEDLDQDGAATPIRALEEWLGGHEGLSEPPDEDWIQIDPGDPEATEIVMTNETGEGWWVSASRTTSGGWVVTQATDHASGCDELSG